MNCRTLILITGILTGCNQVLGGGSLPSAMQVWTPDNRDFTYTNPIIFADYSDPDVVRVGDDFYMTASSFNCSPGLPILHSRDLVNSSAVPRSRGLRLVQVRVMNSVSEFVVRRSSESRL